MSELRRLRLAFERVKRVLLVKLKNSDDLLVFDQLDWIEDRITDLFNLLKKDILSFNSLLDPGFKYTSFSTINTTIEESRELTKRREKSFFNPESGKKSPFYDQPNYSYKEDDLLDTLLKLLLELMEKSEEIGNYNVFHRARYILYMLYGKIAFTQDERFNFHALYGHFTPKLSQVVFARQSRPSAYERKGDLFIAYYIHLDHLVRDDLPEISFAIPVDSVFWSAKAYLDASNFDDIERLVSTLNGRSLDPMWPLMSDLIRESTNYRNQKDIDWRKKLETDVQGLSGYLYTLDQYKKVVNEICRLKQIALEEQDTLQESLLAFLEESENFAVRRFKFRLVQKMQIEVMIYAIFLKSYKLIDFAFDFNRPADSEVAWGSRDVMPADLSEILSFSLQEMAFEQKLIFSWPDHRGIRVYIELFMIKALLGWSVRKYGRWDAGNIYSIVCDLLDREVFGNKNSVRDSLKSVISRYSGRAKFLIENKNWPFHTENAQTSFDRYSTVIEEITESLNNYGENPSGAPSPAMS